MVQEAHVGVLVQGEDTILVEGRRRVHDGSLVQEGSPVGGNPGQAEARRVDSTGAVDVAGN